MSDFTARLREGGPAEDKLAKQAALAALRERMFGETIDAQTFGNYKIRRLIGEGGYGQVYAAHDPTLDRPVALKVLPAGVDLEALLGEARAAASVSHPNVIEIYEIGQTPEGRVFLAMELVEEGSLRTWLDRQPRASQEIIAVFAQIAEGLAAVHAAGLVHGDFKPANVLVDNARPRVADFGLARARDQLITDAAPWLATQGHYISEQELSQELTRGGAFLGTPRYMAPEQHEGQRPDATADQFAFCLTLYEALAKKHPFQADRYEDLARKVLDGELPERWPSSIPRWLRPILRRGLARTSKLRWPDMDTLARKLDRDHRSLRWRWTTVGVSILGVAGVASALSRPPEPTPGSLCAGDDSNREQLWEGPTRQAVQAAFARSGPELNSATWPRLDTAMAHYADDWHQVRRQICEQLRDDLAEEDFDPRVQCLRHRRRAAQSLSTLLANGRGDLLNRSTTAVSSLRPPRECLVMAQGGAAPPPPELADEVERLRERLAEVRALSQLGEFIAAEQKLNEIDVAVEVTEYAPLKAEYYTELGMVDVARGRFSDAVSAHRIAIASAEGAGHFSIAARAYTSMLFPLGDSRTGVSQRELDRARTIVERHAAGTIVETWFHNNLVRIHLAKGESKEAVRAAKHAVELKRRLLPDEHTDIARSLVTWGAAAIADGDYEFAADRLAEAQRMFRRTVGERNPLTAAAGLNLAEAQYELGNLEQARKTITAVLDLGPLLKEGPYFEAHARNVAARILLALDDSEAALAALRPGLAVAEATFEPQDNLRILLAAQRARAWLQESPNERGIAALETLLPRFQSEHAEMKAEAQFDLARSLWEAGESARAQELVREAQATFAMIPGEHWQSQKMRSWLTTHELVSPD